MRCSKEAGNEVVHIGKGGGNNSQLRVVTVSLERWDFPTYLNWNRHGRYGLFRVESDEGCCN